VDGFELVKWNDKIFNVLIVEDFKGYCNNIAVWIFIPCCTFVLSGIPQSFDLESERYILLSTADGSPWIQDGYLVYLRESGN